MQLPRTGESSSATRPDREAQLSLFGSADRRACRDASDRVPAWSPDSAKIAFSSNEGTDQTRPTNNEDNNRSPDWTSDGPNSEIYVMNVDGTGLTRLTNNPTFDSGWPTCH